jgi:hypothetical protein
MKAVDTCVVTISPLELQSVSSYWDKTFQNETAGRVSDRRSYNTSQNVGLAATGCARAGATQEFQLEKRFRAVIPSDGKLTSDLLHIYELQRHFAKLTHLPGLA